MRIKCFSCDSKLSYLNEELSCDKIKLFSFTSGNVFPVHHIYITKNINDFIFEYDGKSYNVYHSNLSNSPLIEIYEIDYKLETLHLIHKNDFKFIKLKTLTQSAVDNCVEFYKDYLVKIVTMQIFK